MILQCAKGHIGQASLRLGMCETTCPQCRGDWTEALLERPGDLALAQALSKVRGTEIRTQNIGETHAA